MPADDGPRWPVWPWPLTPTPPVSLTTAAPDHPDRHRVSGGTYDAAKAQSPIPILYRLRRQQPRLGLHLHHRGEDFTMPANEGSTVACRRWPLRRHRQLSRQLRQRDHPDRAGYRRYLDAAKETSPIPIPIPTVKGTTTTGSTPTPSSVQTSPCRPLTAPPLPVSPMPCADLPPVVTDNCGKPDHPDEAFHRRHL